MYDIINLQGFVWLFYQAERQLAKAMRRMRSKPTIGVSSCNLFDPINLLPIEPEQPPWINIQEALICNRPFTKFVFSTFFHTTPNEWKLILWRVSDYLVAPARRMNLLAFYSSPRAFEPDFGFKCNFIKRLGQPTPNWIFLCGWLDVSFQSGLVIEQARCGRELEIRAVKTGYSQSTILAGCASAPCRMISASSTPKNLSSMKNITCINALYTC